MNLSFIDDLLNREGGYSNNPADKGGETNFGVTVEVARENGYSGEMKDMPRAFAQAVYLKKYWHDPHFDEVAKLCEPLADKMFDIGVLSGPTTATRFLQRALISLGLSSTETGLWGNNDPQCLQHFLTQRGGNGVKVIIFMVAAQQAVAYMNDAIKNPTQSQFEYGWQLNRSLYEVKV